MKNIANDSLKRQEALIALRRELHKFPEIGSDLPNTKKIVCEFLNKEGIPYKELPNDDGIIAEIKGRGQGKTLAFRADMDGLHIDEATNVPFRSQIEGQMHGCGHDAHTAILLLAAQILNEQKDTFNGTVRLLFQTGEETGTGAKIMLQNGALEGVDAVCAIHVGSLTGDEQKAGDLVVLSGPVTAGKNKFTITVRGKGTHTAFPHKGIDSILIGARIIDGCAKYSAEELSQGAILNFGTFNAGIDHNTIPETAILKGGIRVQDPSLREEVGKRLVEICEVAAKSVGGSVEVEIKKGSETVMNDEHLSQLAVHAIKEALGEEKVKTQTCRAVMGSDDFANYASKVPSLYFFLHTNNEEKGIIEANHNPSFDIDESVLWEGVAAYVAIAKKFLA